MKRCATISLNSRSIATYFCLQQTETLVRENALFSLLAMAKGLSSFAHWWLRIYLQKLNIIPSHTSNCALYSWMRFASWLWLKTFACRLSPAVCTDVSLKKVFKKFQVLYRTISDFLQHFYIIIDDFFFCYWVLETQGCISQLRSWFYFAENRVKTLFLP